MQTLWAQGPAAGFTISSSFCEFQRLDLKNTSTNADTYAWDFCLPDFDTLKINSAVATMSGFATGEGVKLVQDNGAWYGFATSRDNNKIFRLDFGNSLENTPAVNDLGNPGGLLHYPEDIDMIKVGGNWYALIASLDQISSAADPGIIKLSFGSSLTAIPTATDVGSFGITGGSRIRNLRCVQQGSNTILVLVDYLGSLVRANLGSTFNTTSPTIVTTGNIPQLGLAMGIDFVKVGTNWLALVNSLNNSTITRINFGSDLMSTFTVEAPFSFTGVSSPDKIKIVREAQNYIAVVSNSSKAMSMINFKDMTSSTTPTVVYHAGLSGLAGLDFVRWQGKEVVWGINNVTTNELRKFVFELSCGASSSFSSLALPSAITYSQNGTKGIELLASQSTSGLSSSYSTTVSVSALPAPDISFTTDGSICAGNPVGFTSSNASGNLTSYAWNFSDSPGSSSANPSHSFSAAGIYQVNLVVTASNSCTNSASTSLTIYNAPLVAFSLPTTSPICSNQSYTLTNTSTFDVGTTPTWQWSVNGTNVATTKNLDYTIPSTSSQSITLIASIPGCAVQATNSINSITAGPKVDFTAATAGCVGSSIKFTNSTTGTATSYVWDFGDGNTSSQTTTASVSNTYASTGPYAVKLTVSNAAGCQNFVSKNISIYSNPQPAFAIEAPPFSCANYPAQFDNNTSPPTDSNIVSWLWAFGDTANGSSSQKNPSYTFTSEGSYKVSLTATTNFGCSATQQNSITIGSSPTANFKTSPACVNQGTQFTDLSNGSITSYEWSVQSAVLSGASPAPYTFKAAGSYPVTLTVTATGGCKNQVTKTVVVPVMPVVDFTVTAPCTRNPTIFQELNTGGSDPAVAWNWSFNGPNSGAGSPFAYTFAVAGGYTVTLTSTRQSGCIYSTSKNVIINNGPIAAFTPTPLAGAAPLTVTFQNNSIADSYQWSFGDADNTTSTTVSPIFTYTKLGKYKARLTANNSYGCTDTLSSEINVVIPRVDLTMQNFSLANDPTTGSTRAVVTIYNSGNIPLTNPDVKIDLAGSAMLKEAIQGTIVPGKSVTTTLSLEIIPRSLDYICAIVNATSDIDPSNDEKCLAGSNTDYLFSPYPNPASGNVNMDWISSANEEVKVSVYKTTGELAFQQQFSNVAPGLVQLSISTTSLSNGLYLIRFEGAKAQKTFRIVVAN